MDTGDGHLEMFLGDEDLILVFAGPSKVLILNSLLVFDMSGT
jgi:hypothetical protein